MSITLRHSNGASVALADIERPYDEVVADWAPTTSWVTGWHVLTDFGESFPAGSFVNAIREARKLADR